MLGEQDVTDTVESADEPVLGNIREEWVWVKRGIEEILAEQPQLTYRPEDVYAACVNGKALLWVFPEGFVVSTAEEDEYSGAKIFFMWLAWVKKRGQSCVIKYMPFFSEIAKKHGFKRIETRTPIPAMEDYFLAEGWKKDTVIYTREM